MPKIRNTVIVNGKRYVCKIWDAGEEVVDRYTILFKAFRVARVGLVTPYIASGSSPRVFWQHGGLENFHLQTGVHLGKRVSFDDLPKDVRECIEAELTT